MNRVPQTLFLLALIMIAAFGVSNRAFAASASPSFTACLAFESTPAGTECRVIANTVGVMIGVENGDAMISYLDPSANGFELQRKESVSVDLQRQVEIGAMSDSQAALVFAELLSSHDLFYRLPENSDVLKNAVGFPPQAVLSPEDHVEVLISHLQIMLGVGADTADYLVAKLGVVVIERAAPELAAELEASAEGELDHPAADPEADPPASVELVDGAEAHPGL